MEVVNWADDILQIDHSHIPRVVSVLFRDTSSIRGSLLNLTIYFGDESKAWENVKRTSKMVCIGLFPQTI